MEKYILQILESNSRVIVPEFGAFIIKQKNPLTIIFNEFLQYNDGMLVDAISKNEGVDRDSAKKKIDEFVNKLNSELNSSGQYALPGIGIVTKNTSGKISLEKEGLKKTEKKESSPAATIEKKPVQDKETKKAAPKKTSAIKEETIEIVKEEPKEDIITEKKEATKPKVEEKPKVEKETPRPQEEKPKIEKEIPSHQEKPKPIKPAPPVKPEEKPKIIVEEKKTERPVYESKYSYRSTPKPESNKRGRTRLIIWLIIIVIVNGALIGYFLYSEEISSMFTKKSNVLTEEEPYQENQLQPEIESTEEDFQDMTPVETIEEPIEEIENMQEPVLSGTRYYIVAGVFRDENNADNLVIDLQNKGYNAEKFGKIGSLHAVSYNVFQTKADANRELRRIQNEEDPEAWIKEVK